MTRPGPRDAHLGAKYARPDSMYEPLSAGLDPDLCANELVEIFDRATHPGTQATT